VVTQIPWSGNQTHKYVIKNSNGDEVATSTLTIEVAGDTTTLSQRSENETASDDINLRVNSSTLKPISSRRVFESEGGDDEEPIEVTYTPQGAQIKQGGRQTGLSVPEHSYDNDSSLFLWRTLSFVTPYEASYNTIITGQRNRQKVNLAVIRKETVTVPAGRFEAWRLEITTSNARQVAWITDDATRTLVRYDNDHNQIFELRQ
jgi:Protein of unknown function (DUF3108)